MTTTGVQALRGVAAVLLVLLAVTAGAADAPPAVRGNVTGKPLQDPFSRRPSVIDPAYGETLYAYYQRQYFDAISRLRVAQDRDELPRQGDDGELLLGGLYVQYGMPDAAREVFTRLVPGTGASPQAQRIWQAIAELDYRRERFPEAMAILESHFVRGQAPEDATMLAVKTLMRLGRYADALAWLGPHAATPESRYLRFNMAVAQVGGGNAEVGATELAALLALPADDDEMRALRDRVALALAATRLQQDRAADALDALAPAQLDGTYSHEALLVYGIAANRAGRQGRAIGALTQLQTRSPHEQAVQEGWIALGQAYEARGDVKRALAAYQSALARLNVELQYLDGQESFIDRGEWFAALEKRAGEIVLRDDRGVLADADVLGLPLHYRQFASHRFVLTFAQYVEVTRLARLAGDWRGRVPVLDYLVESRESRHERLAREAAALLAETAAANYPARQTALAVMTDATLRGDALAWASPAQRKLEEAARGIELRMARWPERDWSSARRRLALLRGVLAWDVARDAPARGWEMKRAVRTNARLVYAQEQLRAGVAEAAAHPPASVAGWRQRLAAEDAELARLDGASRELRTGLRRQLENDARETIRGNRERIVQLAAEAYFAIGQIGHAAWREKHPQGLAPSPAGTTPAATTPSQGEGAGGARSSE